MSESLQGQSDILVCYVLNAQSVANADAYVGLFDTVVQRKKF